MLAETSESFVTSSGEAGAAASAAEARTGVVAPPESRAIRVSSTDVWVAPSLLTSRMIRLAVEPGASPARSMVTFPSAAVAPAPTTIGCPSVALK